MHTILVVAPLLIGAPGNTPPEPPVITEPYEDDLELNPGDVHLEATFSDPDGDQHVCTTWQIIVADTQELVWEAECATGLEAVHAHLGDGEFVGSYAGQTQLEHDVDYLLRVRHRDDSGDPDTEWSAWSPRFFETGEATEVFPKLVEDVADPPAPTWTTTAGGDDVILPGGDTPATVRIESHRGDLLLEYRGHNGIANLVTNPPSIEHHDPIFVRVDAGDTGGPLVLPQSDIAFIDDDCTRHRILLPAIAIETGDFEGFWVDHAGGTWHAHDDDVEPHFDDPARTPSVPWISMQPGYEIDIVATDLQLPVNIAFVPEPGPEPCDPLFYVTELYGAIKVVTRDGTVSDYATDLLNFEPTGNFPGSGEQGVTGIAVEPRTGDVFASMLYEHSGPDKEHYPKVVRFASTDGGLTAATQTTILDMKGEPQGQSHQISCLEFTPDGALWVHVGDGFNPNTARNLNSLRGKILRMLPDGSPHPDNPFYGLKPEWRVRNYIYSYGLRNPFGGAYRAADGKRYEVENGPAIDRLAEVVRGRNFGWTGANFQMRFFALYAWEPAHAPVNIDFIQEETFGGSGFPPSKWDHAFVAESGPTWGYGQQERGKRIVEFDFDDASGALAPIPFVEYVGTGRGTVVALAAGPDGLYFSDFYKDRDYDGPTDRGSNILRVRYVPDVDCNGNGNADDCDLAEGTSADCNANGIPDECDIASGTSDDADGDGIPDECGCPEDVDRDGTVGANDIVEMLAVWGTNDPDADIDGDGLVGANDLVVLLASWGGC